MLIQSFAALVVFKMLSPAIIWYACLFFYFFKVQASQCKRAIVGRFLKSRPQIDTIRPRLSNKFSLEGSVKIGVYDKVQCVHDYNTIFFKRMIELESMSMKWLEFGATLMVPQKEK